MFKNYASIKTPTTSAFWKKLSNDQRSDLIYKELKKETYLNEFEIFKTLISFSISEILL